MTGATYHVSRCSFGLCLRLLLQEPCGILAKPKNNSNLKAKYIHTYMHACMHACIHTYITQHNTT